MRTVEEIIQACAPDGDGDRRESAAQRIAAESNGLTHWAVYKWAEKGIPQRHWDVLMRLAGTTPTELHAANQLLRQTTEAA